MYFTGFYYMSPKSTRTKIVIEITLLLQASFCLWLVQVGYGFLGKDPEVLIAISLVLITHGNENPIHHVPFAYFVFKLKCEVVNFSRSPSACIYGRHINISWCIIST